MKSISVQFNFITLKKKKHKTPNILKKNVFTGFDSSMSSSIKHMMTMRYI